MASLYVAEYTEVFLDNDAVNIARAPPVAEQKLAIGGASVQSVAFNAATRFVRLNTDAICSIAFGNNPTAVTNTNARMAAGNTEYFTVNPGDKVAVISSS